MAASPDAEKPYRAAKPVDDKPVENEQFYMRNMGIAWTAGAPSFDFHDESTDSSAGFELAVTNDVAATIAE